MIERTDFGGVTESSALVDVKIVGHQAAIDTLRSLSRDLQQKGVRSGLHQAAKPLIAAMKNLAPDDSQTPGNRLAASINKTVAKQGRKVRTGLGDRIVKSQDEELSLLVGPNKKYRGKGVGFIGWFTEKGTEAHDIKLKKAKMFHFGFAQDRGYVKKQVISHPGSRALRWQERALASSQGQMQTLFYTGLEKWIAKHGR